MFFILTALERFLGCAITLSAMFCLKRAVALKKSGSADQWKPPPAKDVSNMDNSSGKVYMYSRNLKPKLWMTSVDRSNSSASSFT